MHNCLLLLPLFIVYGGLLASVKIRDRKLARKKEQNLHRQRLEELHNKHAERMALLDNLKKAELEAALSEVEQEISDLEGKTLDGKALED